MVFLHFDRRLGGLMRKRIQMKTYLHGNLFHSAQKQALTLIREEGIKATQYKE